MTFPASKGSARPRIHSSTLVLFLLGAATFAAVTTELLPVGLLPQMAAGLAVSPSQIGLLVSGYAVIVAVASVPLAAVLSRWPHRPVLALLLAGYAASNGATAIAPTYWAAAAARVGGGLIHAAFFSIVFAAAITAVPSDRVGRALTSVSAGTVVAIAVGVPAGTALGQAIGWRGAFGVVATLLLTLAVLCIVVLPNRAADTVAGSGQRLWAAFRRPALLMVIAVVAVFTTGHYALYTYITPLLSDAGVPDSRISPVLFFYGLAGAFGLVGARLIVDRAPRAGLGLTIALTAASLLALGLIHTAPGTIGVVVVWGIATGGFAVLAQAVALRAVPTAPAAAPAAVNAAFNVGICAGALLGARMLAIAPIGHLALVAAALVGVALLLLTIQRR